MALFSQINVSKQHLPGRTKTTKCCVKTALKASVLSVFYEWNRISRNYLPLSYETRILSPWHSLKGQRDLPCSFLSAKKHKQKYRLGDCNKYLLLYFWLRQLFFTKLRFVWWWCFVGLLWSLFNLKNDSTFHVTQIYFKMFHANFNFLLFHLF